MKKPSNAPHFSFTIFTALLISMILLPGGFIQSTVNMDHFFSSHHLFEYAATHGFQFGKDIIDNVGPYGYLHYPYTYAGGAYWSKIGWYALCCLMYAYYAIRLMEDMLTWTEKLLFLFTIAFFPLQIDIPWFSFEIIPRLAVLFSSLYCLRERESSIYLIIINSTFYAFLMFEKISNTGYVIVVVLSLGLFWLLQHKWRKTICLFATFFISAVGFWLAASQPLSGIWTYFQSIKLYIDSYQSIYSLDIQFKLLLFALIDCGLALCILLIRFGIAFSLRRQGFNTIPEFFRCVLISTLVFMFWKHGIGRGLNSYGIFIYSIPCIFAYLFFYPIAGIAEASRKNRFAAWCLNQRASMLRSGLYVLFLSFVFLNLHSLGIPLRAIYDEFEHRLSQLIHAKPLIRYQHFQQEYAILKQQHTLPPALKNQLMHGFIDQFGNEPEIILLNDLPYHPRPMPIHFMVANQALNQLNGRYYQDEKIAPDFVLVPDLDFQLTDTKAYLSLLLNYRHGRFLDNQLLLTKHRPWQQISLLKEQDKNTLIGEWVPLNHFQSSFTWVQIKLQPTNLGRLKHFLYKTDFVTLEIMLVNHEVKRYLISRSELQSGLLINPMILPKNALKFVYYNHQAPWIPVKAFRLTFHSPDLQRYFKKNLQIEFYNLLIATPTQNAATLLTLEKGQKIIKLLDQVTFKDMDSNINLLTTTDSSNVYINGLAQIERDNHGQIQRWGMGPETNFLFFTKQPQRKVLTLRLKNYLAMSNQSVQIYCNQEKLYQTTLNKHKNRLNIKIPIQLKTGVNQLTLKYQDWNHKEIDYAIYDPRQLAVLFTSIQLL